MKIIEIRGEAGGREHLSLLQMFSSFMSSSFVRLLRIGSAIMVDE